jgi:thiosulfate reductase cytochrome b subunit
MGTRGGSDCGGHLRKETWQSALQANTGVRLMRRRLRSRKAGAASEGRSRLGAPACAQDGDHPPADNGTPLLSRHLLFVRITHWIQTFSFVSLLLSGIAILLAYPRLHWGETGTRGTPAFINLPFPFVLDLGIRGPGRYLHFLAAWITLFTGLVYVSLGLRSKHLLRELFPRRSDLRWSAVKSVVSDHLRLKRPTEAEAWHYNLIQRMTYLIVVFLLFPFMFWTGLAMSPTFTSVFPIFVTSLGGEQTARTLHFFDAVLLLLFLVIHVGMVIVAGFGRRCWAMITGHLIPRKKPL